MYASLKYGLDIKTKIIEAGDKGFSDDSISELCEYTISAGKIYVTDFIKYVMDKFDINEALLQNLISLSGCAVNSLSENVMKILDKYQIKISNAHMDAINFQNQLNSQVVAEASVADKHTFVTTNHYPSWGSMVLSYATTRSSMSQAEVSAGFACNAGLSASYEQSSKNIAENQTVKELCNLVDNVTMKFNDDLMELLVLKTNGIFSRDVYNHVKDIEKNPIDTENWIPIFNDIKEEEYNNFKEVVETYGLQVDFSDYFQKELIDGEYNYYLENKKCDYNSKNFDLYNVLDGDRKVIEDSINNKIYDYYNTQINAKDSVLSAEKERIIACDYMSQENKNKLLNSISSYTKKGNKSLIESALTFGGCLLLVIALLCVYGFFIFAYQTNWGSFRTDLLNYWYIVILIFGVPLLIATGFVGFWLYVAWTDLYENLK